MQRIEQIHSEILEESFTYEIVNDKVIEIYGHSPTHSMERYNRTLDNVLLAMGVWERIQRSLLRREVDKLDSLYALYLARSKREPNKYTRKLWRARATKVHGQACALWHQFKAIYGIA